MRPDILFIYPPFTVKERYGKRPIGRVGGHLPPLGLAQLAAFIREQGYSVDLLDAVALDLGVDQTVKRKLASGQAVYREVQTKARESIEFQLNLPAGMYFLELRNADRVQRLDFVVHRRD